MLNIRSRPIGPCLVPTSALLQTAGGPVAVRKELPDPEEVGRDGAERPVVVEEIGRWGDLSQTAFKRAMGLH